MTMQRSQQPLRRFVIEVLRLLDQQRHRCWRPLLVLASSTENAGAACWQCRPHLHCEVYHYRFC